MSEVFPRLINPDAFRANWQDDTFSFTIDTGAIQAELLKALRELDDKLAEPVVVEWLRSRGYHAEKCDGGCNQINGPSEECSLHGRSLSEVWEALAQRTNDLDEARGQLKAARSILREFLDDDECQLDHHGGCQTHGHLEPEPGERCHMVRARELLACSCSGYSEDRGGGYFEHMIERDPDCPEHGKDAEQ